MRFGIMAMITDEDAAPADLARARDRVLPSCGRAQVDVYTVAEQVTAAFEGFPVPLRVAVMGCVVNGPGEAREADLGVSAGNGKGQIIVHGKVIKTVPNIKSSKHSSTKPTAETGQDHPNDAMNECLCSDRARTLDG